MITQLHGDCRQVLPTLPEKSVQCIVTSPPYYGLRDYGIVGQIGQEPIPDCLAWARAEPPCTACYVCSMRSVFRQLWRVLRDDGTAWLNLGDSYSGSSQTGGMSSKEGSTKRSGRMFHATRPKFLPAKSLFLIPPRIGLALQSDGWTVRSRVVWTKDNPMPESVTDRPTRSHEDIYLLAKQERYYYDAAAVAEPAIYVGDNRAIRTDNTQQHGRNGGDSRKRTGRPTGETRNMRDVWSINPQPYSGAHFATFPLAIPDRCIRASTRPGDMVLDPFGGSGTTARAAIALQRDCTLIELNPEYINLQDDRTNGVQLQMIDLYTRNPND